MSGIVKSFDPKFYKSIAKQSFGKSFGFLVVFILILSAVISFKWTANIKATLPEINSWVRKNFEEIIADLPEIEIKNGKLTAPQTNYIKKFEDEFALIVEPDEEKVYSLMKNFPNAIVLTESKLVIKNTKNRGVQAEIKETDLGEVAYFKVTPYQERLEITTSQNSQDKFKVNPVIIKSLLEKFTLIFYPICFLFLLFTLFLRKLVLVLLFSLVSLIINSNFNQPLSYKNLFTIGIYAMVPPTCLAVIVELLGVRIPLFWIVYSSIYIVYLFLAIKIKEGQTWTELVS